MESVAKLIELCLGNMEKVIIVTYANRLEKCSVLKNGCDWVTRPESRGFGSGASRSGGGCRYSNSRAENYSRHQIYSSRSRYQSASYGPSYNKEQYLQATCQFVVMEENYGAHLSDADLIVDWDHIEELRLLAALSNLFVSARCRQDHSLRAHILLGLAFCITCGVSSDLLSDDTMQHLLETFRSSRRFLSLPKFHSRRTFHRRREISRRVSLTTPIVQALILLAIFDAIICTDVAPRKTKPAMQPVQQSAPEHQQGQREKNWTNSNVNFCILSKMHSGMRYKRPWTVTSSRIRAPRNLSPMKERRASLAKGRQRRQRPLDRSGRVMATLSGKMGDPSAVLEKIAEGEHLEVDSIQFAQYMDENDQVKHLRSQFLYPKMRDLPNVDLSVVDGEEDGIYLCGHSLGLQPKGVDKYIHRELDKWAKMGVYGHFMGDTPWAMCDKFVVDGNSRLVGAKSEEIVVMNGLSVNIHLMMIPFYRPTATRHKILLESKAFPSDHYAFESQIRFHGYDPSESMICMEPRQGEYCLRTEDILEVIEREGDSIALMFFSGVHYYTGQLFEINQLTRAAQAKGCIVGWDLAHAAGNVPLHLHDWNIDFATWCSYKYLNSSCGGLGVVFVHERYKDDKDLPRFWGWWSHNEKTRMDMTNKMDLTPGAAGFRISNPPILLVCPMLASLDVFAQTTMDQLREKSFLLTGYLEWLIRKHFKEARSHSDNDKEVSCDILTPTDPHQRGCQLSLLFSVNIHRVHSELQKLGVVCDKRLPYVLRVAPIHTYNSFVDVYRFVCALRKALAKAAQATDDLMINSVAI